MDVEALVIPGWLQPDLTAVVQVMDESVGPAAGSPAPDRYDIPSHTAHLHCTRIRRPGDRGSDRKVRLASAREMMIPSTVAAFAIAASAIAPFWFVVSSCNNTNDSDRVGQNVS
jgi:hypothetical protein